MMLLAEVDEYSFANATLAGIWKAVDANLPKQNKTKPFTLFRIHSVIFISHIYILEIGNFFDS